MCTLTRYTHTQKHARLHTRTHTTYTHSITYTSACQQITFDVPPTHPHTSLTFTQIKRERVEVRERERPTPSSLVSFHTLTTITTTPTPTGGCPVRGKRHSGLPKTTLILTRTEFLRAMVTMSRPVMPEEIWVGVGGLVGWQGV